MDDRTARLGLLLALTPLSVFVFGVVQAATGDDWDAMYWGGLASIFVVSGAITSIWRRYVRWNAARLWVTLALTALLLVQAAVWYPLWNISGCPERQVICTAQNALSLGLWRAGCAAAC